MEFEEDFDPFVLLGFESIKSPKDVEGIALALVTAALHAKTEDLSMDEAASTSIDLVRNLHPANSVMASFILANICAGLLSTVGEMSQTDPKALLQSFAQTVLSKPHPGQS